MNVRDVIGLSVAISLIPSGLGIAGLALRGLVGPALGLYLASFGLYLLALPTRDRWANADGLVWAVRVGCRRLFTLLVLTTLSFLGSCPTWFLAFLIATTLMLWGGYFFIRPLRPRTPLLPGLGKWNAVAQGTVLGVFLSDLFLIQSFPGNFRFSETFHLTGYVLLTSVQFFQMVQGFYQLRRPLLFWIRSPA